MTPDVIHRLEHGKRPAIEVGDWVAWQPRDHDFGANRIRLFRVVGGPRYAKDEYGRAADELWTCDDGDERSRWDLTTVPVLEHARAARALAAVVRSGRFPSSEDDADAVALGARRVAEIARSRGGGSRMAFGWRFEEPDVSEIVAASEELDAALAARREFAHSVLPILAGNLYVASVLALAASWGPSNGEPHPNAPEIPAWRRR